MRLYLLSAFNYVDSDRVFLFIGMFGLRDEPGNITTAQEYFMNLLDYAILFFHKTYTFFTSLKEKHKKKMHLVSSALSSLVIVC